jgi:hypothetical protein
VGWPPDLVECVEIRCIEALRKRRVDAQQLAAGLRNGARSQQVLVENPPEELYVGEFDYDAPSEGVVGREIRVPTYLPGGRTVTPMALDVETPDPPDLTNRGMPDDVDPSNVTDGLSDLRREELEEILQDGAWNEAFREWATYTDLTEAEYRTMEPLPRLIPGDYFTLRPCLDM